MLPQALRAAAALLVVLTVLPAPAMATHDPLVIHKPDLFGAAPEWSGTDEREPSTLCITVYNFAPSGTGPANGYSVLIRIERQLNATTYAVMEEAERRSTKVLMGGESEAFCWAFQLSAGTYRAWSRVDPYEEVDEENEKNNQPTNGATFFVRVRPKPDLIVTYLSVDPRNGTAGAFQSFRIRISNRGAHEALASVAALSDESGPIETFDVPRLRAGDSYTRVVRRLPDDHVPGEFNATVTVDLRNEIDEKDESNNVARRAFAVLPHPLPELRIETVALTGRVTTGTFLTLTALVANAGNWSASNVSVRLYDADGPIANASVGELPARSNASAVFRFDLERGNHTLRAIVDPSFRIAESNESNNVYELPVRIGPTFGEVALPDLVIERFTALPLDPTPGETVSLTVFVRNEGEADAPASNLTIEIDGRPFAVVAIPPLEPDRIHSARVEWANHSQGPHVLQATSDADEDANESNERDNDLTLFLSIVEPRVEQPPEQEDDVPLEEEELPPTDAPDPPPIDLPGDGASDESGSDAPPLTIGQLQKGTRPVPGAARGTFTIQVRNPRLEPLGRVTVTFMIDNVTVKEKLIQSIEAAGIAASSTGEIEIPAGRHAITVEVRIAGDPTFSATASDVYTQDAGFEETPGPSVPLALALACAVALALGRRKAKR